jgi:hypothetical protein
MPPGEFGKSRKALKINEIIVKTRVFQSDDSSGGLPMHFLPRLPVQRGLQVHQR